MHFYERYKAGSYYMGARPVKVIHDPSKFTFEVKSSGGTITGDCLELAKVLKTY